MATLKGVMAMRTTLALMVAGGGLTACTTVATPVASASLQSIEIAAGPCFGTCPIYRATIAADGTGRFAGERFTAVTGERGFVSDPATFRRVADALASYRPARDRAIGPEECERFYTDAPSWTVRWTDRSGAVVTLTLNLGCTDERYRPMAGAIRGANDMLPIGAWVGGR